MKIDRMFENKDKLNFTKELKMSASHPSYDSFKSLILLRHGESLTNLDLSAYGHFKDHEVPLSEYGKKEAVQCGSYWACYCKEKEVNSVLVLHSHYLRAKNTADIIASALKDNVRDVRSEEVEHIHEQLWPECQTLHFDKVKDYLHNCLKLRHKKGIYHYKFPRGGENGQDVSKRAQLFIEEFQTRYLLDSSDLIIVVTHSYFMRVLLKELFEWSIEEFGQIRKPKNCKGYMLSLSGGILTLESNQLAFKDSNEMD
ncbi:histidine phosphatase family protein [Gaetbulibacter jejuensis]|uniref:Histidine phosphatase family protein n=1 Tax=Gaetbulibacter jejuensis TaxID=584607 RepID=A0ABN1JI92_9FLAO